MPSLKRHEGYLMLDNRNSPGISEEMTHAAGLPVGAGQGMFEAPTYTCSHCHRVVVINPLRTRERAYCSKCDHYICDGCGAVMSQTLECKTLNQVLDEMQEKTALDEQRNGIIIST